MCKRFCSMLLAACLLASLLVFPTAAADVVDSGICGKNVTWTIDAEGLLTISGTGPMTDYQASNAPFSYYDPIQSVCIEPGVTTVGDNVFRSCTRMKQITIPAGVTSIGESAFRFCSSLPQVSLPAGVTSIGASAFEGCTALTGVELPAGLTSIGANAFDGCTALTGVDLPASVTSIGAAAFRACGSLTGIALPDGITDISGSLFARCKRLTSVDIPDSVTRIGASAFAQCSSLTEIALPDSVTSIGASAFSDCERLTSVTLPAKLSALEASAFSGCAALKDVDDQDYFAGHDVPQACFKGCTALEGFAAGRNVEESAFSDCTSLETFTMSGGKEIEAQAFAGCTALREVSLPGSLTTVAANAFRDAEALTDVYFDGTEAAWEDVSVKSTGNAPLLGATMHFACVHDPAVRGSVDASCTEAGCTGDTYCTICGELLESGKVIPALGHQTALRGEKPATCTEPGMTNEEYCTVCGKILKSSEVIPALGHQTALRGEKPATCTEPGTTNEEYCTVCGEILKASETIPTAGHSWGDWTETKPASETSGGEEARTCAVCGESETRATPALPPANPFSDVKEGTYYYAPVLWAVRHEPQITAGTAKNAFSPNAFCTRGQIVTFLWRAYGCPPPTITESPFTDVKPSDYFCKAVLWAVEHGITTGTSKTAFSPNATVTRAQAVTFLWRAAGKPAAQTKNPFADVSAGAYYTQAVLWAVEHGVTTGTSKTAFSPGDPCTRAQCVTFLHRDLA